MENALPLSVCIITFNEEENIGKCLQSVQWVDDIVVVDSGSEDRTCELAEGYGARVIHRDWPGHKEQKQYATDQAKYDWVLSLDADEEVTAELAGAIQRTFQGGSPDPYTGFTVNRVNYYLGRWHKYGSFQPDVRLRLYNRKTTRWGGTNPHDRVLSPGKTQHLKGNLLHSPYKNLADHVDYMNRYTDIMATEKLKEGTKGAFGKAIFHPAFKFFRDYFLKRGFMDGKAGFVNATLGAVYNFLKYAKVWERKKEDGENLTTGGKKESEKPDQS